jgi:hypothetical protein
MTQQQGPDVDVESRRSTTPARSIPPGSIRRRPDGVNRWATPLLALAAMGSVAALSAFLGQGRAPATAGATPPMTATALPSSPVTAASAVAEAKTHVDATAVLVSARGGQFADVKAPGPAVDSGPVDDLSSTRLVWAVTFSADFVICPPDGAPCWSPRPGTTIVYLDYLTGEYLESASFAPAP